MNKLKNLSLNNIVAAHTVVLEGQPCTLLIVSLRLPDRSVVRCCIESSPGFILVGRPLEQASVALVERDEGRRLI
jgi:hypothetical protein